MGCGYGDMVAAVFEAGGSVLGIDHDFDIVKAANDRMTERFQLGPAIFQMGIEDLSRTIPYDIIICFSVLPYLLDKDKVLHWINDYSTTALLEVQYLGDGPGMVRDDILMQELLMLIFDSATPIGKTLVDYRNKWRTIWLCE